MTSFPQRRALAAGGGLAVRGGPVRLRHGGGGWGHAAYRLGPLHHRVEADHGGPAAAERPCLARTSQPTRPRPQYRLVNRGMSLGDFKFIFWWEWAHRLLGRLVGVAFGLPMVVFLVTRRLPRRLIWRCAILLGLGGLQGLVGWWMVQSGLEARAICGRARAAGDPPRPGAGPVLRPDLDRRWRPGPARRGRRAHATAGRSPAAFLAGVFLQCLLGALVAGNRAGLVYNDWPMMDGRSSRRTTGPARSGPPWPTASPPCSSITG